MDNEKLEAYKKKMQQIKADDDETLPSVLQFFASSDAEKVLFLPERISGCSYAINDCGDKTENPLHFLTCASYELIKRYSRSHPEKQILNEISALLEMSMHLRELGMRAGEISDIACSRERVRPGGDATAVL